MNKLLTILFLILSIKSYSTTYYVSNSGSDANSGLTQVLAWQTTAKVNSVPFSAGDSILFKRGDTFYGGIIATNIGRVGNDNSTVNYTIINP